MRELERVADENQSLGESNLALLGQREQLSGELAAQARALDTQQVALREERRGREQLESEVQVLRSTVQKGAANGSADAVAELEAFTYTVSHDMRSPLGAILNYTAILSDDYAERLDAAAREHLARITASARNAVAMMDGLLAFSRVGRHELVLAEVDVRALVREIHAELCAGLNGHGGARPDLSPDPSPDLSMGELPSVRADPTLLRTLFTNLLGNAFKFTRAVPEPRIEVGGYVQGESTVFYVEDNGIGFDMRHADKLFAVFERLVSQADYEGHGVGLAIVARIAERHGGGVRAEGAPGKGATFFVTLPIRTT
jgi:signal transduction histidine kinase